MKIKRHLLLLMLCSLSMALVIETKKVPDSILLKGELTPKHIESIQLPFDATLTPMQPYNTAIHKGDPLFNIEHAESGHSPLKIILDYLQQQRQMMLAQQHMQAQTELKQLDAISLKAYHESLIEFETKQLALIEKQNALNEIIKPFNINVAEIEGLQGENIEHIASYVNLKIPTQIVAPIDGIFISSSDSEQNRATFFKKNTEVAMVVDDSDYELTLKVSDKHISKLSDGQSVKVKIPAIHESITGSIASIASYPKKVGSNYNYSVVVHFDNIDDDILSKLKVGMNCSISITLDENEIILIPLSAIKPMLNQSFVFMQKGGVKTPVEVTLGRTYGMDVQVLSGLEVGDKILESA